MCRSILEGGRRCPGHSHPERVAAYNAIRRERYHANKQSNLPEPVASTLAPEFFTPNPLITEANFVELGLTVIEAEGAELGISATKNEGHLVEVGYFAQTTVRGKLNYTKLTNESYKTLGFSEVTELTASEKEDLNNSFDNKDAIWSRVLTPATISYDPSGNHEASKLEIKHLSSLEQRSLKFFTSNNYKWMNEGLYKNKYDTSADMDTTVELETLLEESENDYEGYDVPNEHQNKENLRRITDVLDEALTKGPKKQRIVYRGVAQYAEVFKEFNGINGWVDANAQLGQELKFEGYQSTTNSLFQASQYAEAEEGLIFEIRTPEGVNIQAESYWSEEQEILLPRQARYMVVGVHKETKLKDCYGRKTVVQLVAINEQGDILDGTNSTPPTAI